MTTVSAATPRSWINESKCRDHDPVETQYKQGRLTATDCCALPSVSNTSFVTGNGLIVSCNGEWRLHYAACSKYGDELAVEFKNNWSTRDSIEQFEQGATSVESRFLAKEQERKTGSSILFIPERILHSDAAQETVTNKMVDELRNQINTNMGHWETAGSSEPEISLIQKADSSATARDRKTQPEDWVRSTRLRSHDQSVTWMIVFDWWRTTVSVPDHQHFDSDIFKIKKFALMASDHSCVFCFFEISVEDHFFRVIIMSLSVIFGLKNPPPWVVCLGQRELPNIYVNLVTLSFLSLWCIRL